MDVVIFTRVSTHVQDNNRQVADLTSLAESREWNVKHIFCEQISGAAKNSNRTVLTELLDYVKKHDIKKVLVTELSRLGRDTFQVLEVVNQLNEIRVSLYIQNYNIETLTADGKVNAMSQFLVPILAEVAKMERTTIRERMQSGYENYRKSGGKVGRRTGTVKDTAKMKEDYAEETRLLRKGISLRNISKITGTAVNTIQKCKRLIL